MRDDGHHRRHRAADTVKVYAASSVSPEIVREQMLAVADIGADTIKIGMLGNAAIAAAVADALANISYGPWCSIPCWHRAAASALLGQKRGTRNSQEPASSCRATLVTPNSPENLRRLVGALRRAPTTDFRGGRRRCFAALGARAHIPFKGGHGERNKTCAMYSLMGGGKRMGLSNRRART